MNKNNHKKNKNGEKKDCPRELNFGKYSPEPESLEKKENQEVDLGKYFSEIYKNAVEIEILASFLKNEYQMSDFGNLAEMLKREDTIVKEILDQLVKNEILEKMGEGHGAIYSLTTNPDKKERFNDLTTKLFGEIKNLKSKK